MPFFCSKLVVRSAGTDFCKTFLWDKGHHYHSIFQRKNVDFSANGRNLDANGKNAGIKSCRGLQRQHDFSGKHALFTLAVDKTVVLFGDAVDAEQTESMGRFFGFCGVESSVFPAAGTQVGVTDGDVELVLQGVDVDTDEAVGGILQHHAAFDGVGQKVT